MSVTTYGSENTLGTLTGGRPYQYFDPPPAMAVSWPQALVQVAVDGRPVIPRGPMHNHQTIAAYEGVRLTTMARLANAQRIALYRTHVSSVLLNVFDLTSAAKSTAVHSEQLDVDQVMMTGAILDAGWNADAIGYGFRHEADGFAFLFEGGRAYRLEYVFQTYDYGPIPLTVEVQTQGLMTPRSEF